MIAGYEFQDDSVESDEIKLGGTMTTSQELHFTVGQPIKYKFNEPELMREIWDYINSTYGEHYAQEKIQAVEFIADSGLGMGFTLGNIMKYGKRFGKKDGYNRKDLMKIVHYAILALYCHDLEHGQE